MAPMKIDLSDIEGSDLSHIFNELGNPDYDLSVKDIMGWQSHRYLIRQNVELRIKESNIKSTAFPVSISVSNTLGKETYISNYQNTQDLTEITILLERPP